LLNLSYRFSFKQQNAAVPNKITKAPTKAPLNIAIVDFEWSLTGTIFSTSTQTVQHYYTYKNGRKIRIEF